MTRGAAIPKDVTRGAAPGSRGSLRHALALALLLIAAAAPARSAIAQSAGGGPRVALDDIRGSATVTPPAASLGEALTYRVTVKADHLFKVRFLPPDAGGAFTWGRLTARRTTHPNEPAVGPGAWIQGSNEVVAEVPLQVFAHGEVSIPGLIIDVDDGRGPRRMRVPIARVAIAPMVAANDTSADLRPVRGPLAAPWWERVPWTLVALALLLIATLVFAWWRWRNRRRHAAPAAMPVARAVDPRATALNELAALRRLGLPAKGEFAEHAFRLTRIVRRFVEAATGFARPGDTTPELVERLAASTLSGDEVKRLEGLLRYWDRIKFARVPTTPEESVRAEQSVEEFLRHARPAPVPASGGKAA